MKNSLNLGLAVLFLVVLGCSCPSKLAELGKKEAPTPAATPTTRSTPATTTTTKGDYDLSIEKFNKLKIGMPRSEVENTLGGKGTEISSTVGGGMRFSVNKWEGDSFKSIIISFKNDKIMSKSQVGLK